MSISLNNKAFDVLEVEESRHMTPKTSLTRIGGHNIPLIGTVVLHIKVEDEILRWKSETEFIEVDINLPYNMVVRRPLIGYSRGDISIHRLQWQISTDQGLVISRGTYFSTKMLSRFKQIMNSWGS
ncbi:hypothetical protein M5689_003722 [Euphorbia peplus]|nr:hypothetical protein M5689_003722 [Euphorbia peplus]